MLGDTSFMRIQKQDARFPNLRHKYIRPAEETTVDQRL
jgi:hypothetical protein